MNDQAALAVRPVNLFTTSAGGRIYQLPLEEFPGLWGYVYIVLVQDGQAEYRVLVDAGSGFGDSNAQLEAGFRAASDQEGRPLALETLTHIFITHGHIDHFGGLAYLRPRTKALIGVHELDRRILTHYEERLAVAARRLNEFLIEAGIGEERRTRLIEMYKITKGLYHSVAVDFTYEAAGMRVGPFEILHTPGHCAGHVVIRLHDVLFSGDHILAHTSPHQSPEHLTLSTGLEHYLRSLETLRAWGGGTRLTLAGHKDPILDLEARLDEIRALHMQRLQQVLQMLDEPHTVNEISHTLFKDVRGYNVLLALEEAGAHVEYLYQRGFLGIENLPDLEASDQRTPVRYYRL